MNTNQHEHDGRDARADAQRLHELLCATILGEANADEREEVERALATSPELRAERARLEATIGVVTSTLKQDGALSPSAADALHTALNRRRVVAWYRSSAFRIAASLALLPLAWLTWRVVATKVESERQNADEAVAMVERDDLAGARDKDSLQNAGESEKRNSPGSAGAAAAPSSPKLLSGSATDNSALKPAADSNSPAPEVAQAKREELPALTSGVVQLGKQVAPATAPGVAPDAGALLVARGGATPERSEHDANQSGLTGSDDFFVGTYRGAGDETRAESGTDSLDAKTGVIVVTKSIAPVAEKERSTGEAVGRVGGRVLVGGGGGGDAGALQSRSQLAQRGAVVAPGSTKADDGRANQLSAHRSAPQSAGANGQGQSALPALGYLSDRDESARDQLKQLGYVDDSAKDDVTVEGNEIRRLRKLSPSDIDSRIDLILGACRRRTGEAPRDMFFRFWGDNPFELTELHKLSTFSIDVDTASYALTRNYLTHGALPPKEAVRTEEFVNYFKGDVQPPHDAAFAVETEMAPSLFGETPECWMLRVAVRGKDVAKSERAPLNLTFVIDVSGSMREGGQLELVKHSLRLLAAQLDARDCVAIVTFSADAKLILPMTSAKNRVLIENAIDPLQPDQSTNTEAGLRLGYEVALQNLSRNSQNRVVLLTDGVANVGVTDPNVMTAEVETERKAGIYLNTIGVGLNNHNDALLEQLADKGDGLCNYVDDAKEAQRALVDNFTGAFQPIARDVKIQVEFDPAQVERFRLLGYENRALADQDFRNDRVDAGEVGAGHQVVALYELVRNRTASEAPLATVRLRWKPPYGEGGRSAASEVAQEIAHPVTFRSASDAYARTTAGYRRSVLVAQFAEFLRRSVHARGDSFDRLIGEAQKLDGELKDPDFHEFVALVAAAKSLVLAAQPNNEVQAKLDNLRREQCLRAELGDRRAAQAELEASERRAAELEGELRALLKARLQRDDASTDGIRTLGYTDR